MSTYKQYVKQCTWCDAKHFTQLYALLLHDLIVACLIQWELFSYHLTSQFFLIQNVFTESLNKGSDEILVDISSIILQMEFASDCIVW